MTRHDKTRQDKQGKTNKTRQGKTRQDKARQDKTRFVWSLPQRQNMLFRVMVKVRVRG